jgi:hypothetical protein
MMKHIKKYNLFKESRTEDYSIYEFFNMLAYHYEDNVPQSKVKILSDKFIGEGIYDKVKLMVDDIFEKFEGINLNELEMRFTEFSDYYEKECSIFFIILVSNLRDYDKEIDERYNSSRGFNKNRMNKESFINDIIRDIIQPTLKVYEIGTEQRIRQSEEEIYVNDPKWNCVNFNIDDYISKNDLKMFAPLRRDLRSYSVDKYLNDMYVPALNIKIGNYSDGMTMKLNEIEERLDSTIGNTIFDIPHSDIIWDSARFKRRFDPNIDIYEYNVKVILE